MPSMPTRCPPGPGACSRALGAKRPMSQVHTPVITLPRSPVIAVGAKARNPRPKAAASVGSRMPEVSRVTADPQKMIDHSRRPCCRNNRATAFGIAANDRRRSDQPASIPYTTRLVMVRDMTAM